MFPKAHEVLEKMWKTFFLIWIRKLCLFLLLKKRDYKNKHFLDAYFHDANNFSQK